MIDPKKLLVDLNRMCHSYDMCTHCDLFEQRNLFEQRICDGRINKISIFRLSECHDIVSKWAEQHPVKTYLSEFLDRYPNAPLNEDGVPDRFCPGDLGYDNLSDCAGCECTQCWNQPVINEDKS